MITLKNNKHYMVNLGCIKGTSLVFSPHQTKLIDKATEEKFEYEISRYVEGGMLSVVKVDKPRTKVVEDVPSEPVVTDSAPKVEDKPKRKRKKEE